ncbi:MAG: hypothetical protein K0R38_3374, partial [Polyangiaceae bacterium]|nr:hypothetical protein [Polyangiaceae bacterium]
SHAFEPGARARLLAGLLQHATGHVFLPKHGTSRIRGRVPEARDARGRLASIRVAFGAAAVRQECSFQLLGEGAILYDERVLFQLIQRERIEID